MDPFPCDSPVCYELDAARREGTWVLTACKTEIRAQWTADGITGHGTGATIAQAWDRCTEDWAQQKQKVVELLNVRL